MAIYTQQPRRNRDAFDLDEYGQVPQPQVYSVAHIVFIDGTTTEFMVKASPGVVPHLTKEMNTTGYLTLWNDTDTLCIRAEQIKHFSMRQLTTNEGVNK